MLRSGTKRGWRAISGITGSLGGGSMASHSWATVNPTEMSSRRPARGKNLVGGVWRCAAAERTVIDPLTGETFANIPRTTPEELDPFVHSMLECPNFGLHNPLHRPERYGLYGGVAALAAERLRDPAVADFFAALVQRVAPKHWAQASGEVRVVTKWLESFSGDTVRQLGRSFGVPGDHVGQESRGYRWPYGHVCVITPFNFPLEIPTLQMLSALFMGNKVLLKVDERVAIVMEQMVRLLIDCGMPAEDVDVLYADGLVTNELMLRTMPRMTLFTGSQNVAEKLCADMNGRIKLEDAGFDWKILGPDVGDVPYVVWQSDQDAYAFSGQKCSAQSIVFMHSNWADAGFIEGIAARAAARSITDLSKGPVLSVTTEQMQQHVDALAAIPGAKVLFGGEPLKEPHNIPECYGAFEPTAVFVPLEAAADPAYFATTTHECFGPVQVVTEYADEQLDTVLEMCERMDAQLSAGIVSNDAVFVNQVLGRTVNGTTYVGRRGRTTGAPANHWFGPAGDPRAGGIHTIEAIQNTWSGHREIIHDVEVPKEWTAPHPT